LRNSPAGAFTDEDHVVETLAADSRDDAFSINVLLRAANTGMTERSGEGIAKRWGVSPEQSESMTSTPEFSNNIRNACVTED